MSWQTKAICAGVVLIALVLLFGMNRISDANDDVVVSKNVTTCERVQMITRIYKSGNKSVRMLCVDKNNPAQEEGETKEEGIE